MELNIASIDPGSTTGIAIANVLIEEKEMVFRHRALDSLQDVRDVYRLIEMHRPDTVFMERRAENGSRSGIQSYERITNGLIVLGYTQAPGGRRKEIGAGLKGLILISPGIWKPYMQVVTTASDFSAGSWVPHTQHEEDALALLHYGMLFNVQPIRKVVRYE
jgi:hypothetical protein